MDQDNNWVVGDEGISKSLAISLLACLSLPTQAIPKLIFQSSMP